MKRDRGNTCFVVRGTRERWWQICWRSTATGCRALLCGHLPQQVQSHKNLIILLYPDNLNSSILPCCKVERWSLLCCWNSETHGSVFKSACEVWTLKSICFLHKRYSRLAAETQWPWLWYGDLQVEQNSRLSCQTPLQSALLIRPRNNTSLELDFGEFI